ncbi:MAG: hypothetical protein Q7S28_00610 [bacterium]|nr:hypothetical protein [bacterium]
MKKVLIISIGVIALSIVGGIFLFRGQEPALMPPSAGGPPAPPTPVPTTDEEAVRDLVTRFGEKLRMVSLAAPKELLISQIEEAYSPFVSEGLLTAWRENPERAPGRFTSNPWPEKIEILLVEPSDEGSYEVQGKVIEITSINEVNGGSANEYPVALKIRNQNGKWVITGFTKMIQQQ